MKISFQEQNLLARFLSNISIARKMALIVIILIMGILSMMAVSWFGLQTMSFHVSNLYDFMLIPISAIKDADIALTSTQTEFYRLQGNSKEAIQTQILNNIQENV